MQLVQASLAPIKPSLNSKKWSLFRNVVSRPVPIASTHNTHKPGKRKLPGTEQLNLGCWWKLWLQQERLKNCDPCRMKVTVRGYDWSHGLIFTATCSELHMSLLHLWRLHLKLWKIIQPKLWKLDLRWSLDWSSVEVERNSKSMMISAWQSYKAWGVRWDDAPSYL